MNVFNRTDLFSAFTQYNTISRVNASEFYLFQIFFQKTVTIARHLAL
jgi:hypothetical protein